MGQLSDQGRFRMQNGISVVIPSWNGWPLLQQFLPSVLRAAQVYRERRRGETEVIVVDDGSEDSTREALPRTFPEVKLLRRPENGGFAKACNSGFQQCRFPLIALLNNDVRLEEDYLCHPVDHFSDPEVFAVTARVFEFDPPRFATGGKVGRFRRGFWSVYFNYDCPEEGPPGSPAKLLSVYAVGGFAVYDRSKLEILQGFNELLSPFHWEDVDLSYRAWKRGWRVEYEPRSVGYHRISATIDAHYEKREVEVLALRNRLLFHWINLHSPVLWGQHCLMLLVLCVTRILVGDLGFYRAFAGAWAQRREAARLRGQERIGSRRSDRDLVRIFREFFSRAPIRIYRGRKEVDQFGPKPPQRRTDQG